MSIRQTFLDADQAARTEAIRLAMTGQLSFEFVERHYGLTPVEQRELRRLKAAGAIADDADSYVAIAKGNDMPASWYRRRLSQLRQS